MRSLLFVPGDRPEMLRKAQAAGADALVLDLAYSVDPGRKGEARRSALAFLREMRGAARRPRIFVRINGFDGPHAEADLDAVMTAGPDGVMLPKARGGSDAALLASRLAVREALHGLPDGATLILPITTEAAASLSRLETYAGASRRLCGLTWGAEDLAAAPAASASRDERAWTEPFQLVRRLCLFGAAAAGVPAFDAVHRDPGDHGGLLRACAEAARDGFAGKLAIDPAQVAVINDAFTPS